MAGSRLHLHINTGFNLSSEFIAIHPVSAENDWIDKLPASGVAVAPAWQAGLAPSAGY
jgi:hypothetical protein